MRKIRELNRAFAAIFKVVECESTGRAGDGERIVGEGQADSAYFPLAAEQDLERRLVLAMVRICQRLDVVQADEQDNDFGTTAKL